MIGSRLTSRAAFGSATKHDPKVVRLAYVFNVARLGGPRTFHVLSKSMDSADLMYCSMSRHALFCGNKLSTSFPKLPSGLGIRFGMSTLNGRHILLLPIYDCDFRNWVNQT